MYGGVWRYFPTFSSAVNQIQMQNQPTTSLKGDKNDIQKPNELHVVTEDGEQCFMWRSNQLTYIAPNRKELPLVLANKFGHLATKLDLSYNNLTSFRNINLFINLNELILDNNCLEDDQLEFRQNLRLKTLSLNKNKLCDLFKLIISIKVCFPNLEFLSLIGNQFYPIQISPTAGGGTSSSITTAAASRSSHHPEASVRPDSCASSADSCDRYYSFEYNQPVDLCEYSSSESGGGGRQLSCDVVDRQAEFANQRYRYFIINHLPNLHFLDSNPIGHQERDEALNSCFWVKSPTTTAGQPIRPPIIICGQQQQTMQNSLAVQVYSSPHYGGDNRSLNGHNQLKVIRNSDHHDHQLGRSICLRDQQQLQLVTANGEHHQPKGQFSQQVKCQMVGGFTFARTLLWTLMSLTSPINIVHCSYAVLALSFKGTVKSVKNRRESNNSCSNGNSNSKKKG